MEPTLAALLVLTKFIMKAPLLQILSSVFAFILTVATAGSIYADTFSFDDVKFVRENSDGSTSKWSQLILSLIHI